MPNPSHPVSRALLFSLFLLGSVPRMALAASDFERYLAAAVSLYESLEYERALEQLGRARTLASGIQQDTAIALHEGIILAELGRWEDARAAFRTALVLEPDAKLPLRVAPKVEREFEGVRARVSRDAVRRQQGVASRPLPSPSPAPASEGPPPTTPGVAPLRPAPERPVAAAPAAAAAVDRPERQRPPVLTPPPSEASVLSPSVEARRSRPVTVPLVLLGTGVAAAGVGTYFGVTSRGQVSAAREALHEDTALAHLDEARGSARVANILFGTAGLAATGALLTYLLTPGDTSSGAEVSR